MGTIFGTNGESIYNSSSLIHELNQGTEEALREAKKMFPRPKKESEELVYLPPTQETKIDNLTQPQSQDSSDSEDSEHQP